MNRKSVLRPGDHAPDVMVAGPDRASIQLGSLWKDKPLVLSFLRHFG
jgi:peroxiredoxin